MTCILLLVKGRENRIAWCIRYSIERQLQLVNLTCGVITRANVSSCVHQNTGQLPLWVEIDRIFLLRNMTWLLTLNVHLASHYRTGSHDKASGCLLKSNHNVCGTLCPYARRQANNRLSYIHRNAVVYHQNNLCSEYSFSVTLSWNSLCGIDLFLQSCRIKWNTFNEVQLR